MNSIKSICVYCGSSSVENSNYIQGAGKLGSLLASKNIRLIYGGAKVGIMGEIADAVLSQGGEVTGIIPENLVDFEVAHQGLTQLEIVKSMHERKARMAELADAFIALPGGLGTLDEIFEVLTWAQLGLHTKPCGLLNINGYFDKLSEFLDHANSEKFIKNHHRSMLMIERNAELLLDKFKTYKAPNNGKWKEEVRNNAMRIEDKRFKQNDQKKLKNLRGKLHWEGDIEKMRKDN
jgi:hypothetical protein